MEIKRLVMGLMRSNVYIVKNEDTHQAILIDAGGKSTDILSEVYKQDAQLSAIILTHGHIDHINAVNGIMKKISPELYIHKEELEYLYDPSYNLSNKYFKKDFVYSGKVHKAIEQDEIINIAGFDVEFIHTPGHSPGSMCIAIEDVIFTGDTLFMNSIGNAIFPGGDIVSEKISIKAKLFSRPRDATCYPGHGLSTPLFHERDNNIYMR